MEVRFKDFNMLFPFSFWTRIRLLIIPMDGNGGLSGTSSASSVGAPPSNSSWNAFDGNPATYWSPANNSGSAWLQFQFRHPRLLLSFYLDMFQSITFTLDGSNDGSSWNTISSQSNSQPTSHYIVSNSRTRYSYFRLNIASFSGGLGIKTLSLYGY